MFNTDFKNVLCVAEDRNASSSSFEHHTYKKKVIKTAFTKLCYKLLAIPKIYKIKIQCWQVKRHLSQYNQAVSYSTDFRETSRKYRC